MMAQKFIRNSGVDTLVSQEPWGFFDMYLRAHDGPLKTLLGSFEGSKRGPL